MDLTLLGVGSMVGAGIYIMTGIAARELAGPAIVISFIGAALAVCLVAICYTEFASRVHKTGTTYLYTYFTLGELPAFLIGWSILVLIIFGGAMNAQAWSAYLDFLCDKAIVNMTRRYIGEWHVGQPFRSQPDFVAVTVILIMTTIVSFGVQCSARVNSVFTFINITVLLFVTIIGFMYSDISNWTSKESGGFMPFGWTGVLKGSGACFWALTGFEIIALSVEEAKNPRRSVPLSSALSIVTVTILYIGTSAAITLMSPYSSIGTEAPLPSVFANNGLTWGRYIVSVGPLLGLTTTLLSSSFSFVRLAYAIAQDGLLFSFCAQVNNYSRVPVISTVINGCATAAVAFCLDLREIIGFSVVLSLLQYILVAAAVIILRYQPPSGNRNVDVESDKTSACDSEDEAGSNVAESNMDSADSSGSESELVLRKRNNSVPFRNSMAPCHYDCPMPGHLRTSFHWLQPFIHLSPLPWVPVAITAMTVCLTLLALLILKTDLALWWTRLLVGFILLAVMLLVLSIYAHQQNTGGSHLQVPLVPFLPAVSMFACLVLLVSTASIMNWVGCFVVFVAGTIVYFGYGIRHSKLNVELLSGDSLNDASISLLTTK